MNQTTKIMLAGLLSASLAACSSGGSGSDDSVSVGGSSDPTVATLTVTKNSGGTVASGGGEIDCGSDCSHSVNDAGIDLVLTATADSGYAFDSWSNCPAESSNQCTVSIAEDGSLSVQANFVQTDAILNVTGSSGGTVNSGSLEINCGSSCSYQSSSAISLTLTAYPDEGEYEFDGWTNCPTPIDNTCSVSVATGETLDVEASFNFTGAVANILTDWVINNTNEVTAHIDGGSTLVNVQSVTEQTVNTKSYVVVSTTGIPNYTLTMTQDLIDWLNGRPRASLMGPGASNSDFVSDTDGDSVRNTSAVLNQVIAFGEDINYRSDSAETTCATNQGYGYWPPGPTCPEDQSKQGYFPQEPVESATECDTALAASGYAVNGVSIYNWNDGQSYNGEGAWQTLAAFAEVYDVDICGGHAAGGDYHHHFYSDCWAETAGEDFSGHSEVYGYAADGYPVYGPYEETNVLAQSCWKARDYTVGPTDEGYGCVGFNGAVSGERNCVLVDPYDPSQGVEAASADGPTTSGTYTSLSNNSYDTTAGFFYQDYYYDSDCTALGDGYLDEYSGHSDAERGYHYHLTLANEPGDNGDAVLPTPAFPFTFGPRYRGELQDNAIASCSGSAGGGGMPPPPL